MARRGPRHCDASETLFAIVHTWCTALDDRPSVSCSVLRQLHGRCHVIVCRRWGDQRRRVWRDFDIRGAATPGRRASCDPYWYLVGRGLRRHDLDVLGDHRRGQRVCAPRVRLWRGGAPAGSATRVTRCPGGRRAASNLTNAEAHKRSIELLRLRRNSYLTRLQLSSGVSQSQTSHR
jgi:hypothetical protein